MGVVERPLSMDEEKCIIDPSRDCIGRAEAAKLEGRIKALEEWRDDSKDFHAKFYDWQREQIARDAKLDEKLSNMDANIQKLVNKDDQQNSNHKKRVNDLIDKAVWAVLAAVIAFMLAKFGL